MQNRIYELLEEYKNKKVSYSIKLPYLRIFFVCIKRMQRDISDISTRFAQHTWEKKEYIAVRHQSVLMRKLWDVDMQLQKNKSTNIQKAIEKLDGIVIEPGETFSFWRLVWKPSYKKWYLDGLVLRHGWPSIWVWWWLCQLSNLLYWMFLHLDIQVIERHRHSYDIFPDSGRVLPFASGATIFYNYVDLRVKNTLSHPIQIKLWTNDKYLKGQIRSDIIIPEKFHVYEKFHSFVSNKSNLFRYNLIHREKKIAWKVLKDEKVLENFSPVKYKTTIESLKEKWHKVVEI